MVWAVAKILTCSIPFRSNVLVVRNNVLLVRSNVLVVRSNVLVVRSNVLVVRSNLLVVRICNFCLIVHATIANLNLAFIKYFMIFMVFPEVSL